MSALGIMPSSVSMSPPQGLTGAGKAAGVFLGLATLIFFATSRPGGSIDFFESGHWLGPASDMLAGKIPYRETFPVHGFLSDGGLDFLLFFFFGPSFPLSLAAHHLLGCLFQPTLFLVGAAAAIPLNIALATGILADRPVLPLLSLAAFLLAIDKTPRRGSALLAGLLAGAGLLHALDFGTFILVAEVATTLFLLIAVRERDQRPLACTCYFLGLSAVLVPFLIYLQLVRALLPFLRTSFIDLPRWIHPVWGWDFPGPWMVMRSWISGEPYRIGELTIGLGVIKRLYLAPLFAGLGGLSAFAVRRFPALRPLAVRLVVISIACACFFRYVVARLHLEVGNALIGPLLLLILVTVHTAACSRLTGDKLRRLERGLVLAGMSVFLAMNGPAHSYRVLRAAAGYPERMTSRVGLEPLSTPRGGGALVLPNERREIETLASWFCREVPHSSSMLDLSNRPALYFFLDHPNATRFYQVPLMSPFQDEVLRDLRGRPPAVVLLQRDTPYDTADGVPNPARIPRVWSYLERAFPYRLRVGETLLALPRAPSGGQTDLCSRGFGRRSSGPTQTKHLLAGLGRFGGPTARVFNGLNLTTASVPLSAIARTRAGHPAAGVDWRPLAKFLAGRPPAEGAVLHQLDPALRDASFGLRR